jgi:glycosyltransferase involved in cell wall biosynthesis
MPLISVVVPLYDKARTVMTTLQRALAQSFADFEIIVVDDGSRDGSGALVETLRDPRLILIRQENAGVSAARNRGIMAARGQWIAFLDADDEWDTGHLSSLWDALKSHEVVAGFSNARVESRDGAPKLGADVPAQVILDYFDFALAQNGYPQQTSATIIRRDAAIEAGLFAVGAAMGEDVDLWCRLALRGPMLYTAACTATYNDVPRETSAAHYLQRTPEYPCFAASLSRLFDKGEVPSHLAMSARRYANFLLLEYARQLLERGLYAKARDVLYRHCDARLDPVRFSRRLARTYTLGRIAHALIRGKIHRG